MKCKKIQEQRNVNLQLKNKKKQKLKQKGITLIALVVTIIILLILAGVTLNMALSGDGLFSKARNAADKYKKAQEDEQDLISEIGKEMNSEYVGAFVTGYNPKIKAEGCTIGATTSGIDESQTIHTETMKWRIWDYDGTTLRLISEKPTEATLQLKGTAGYNNGVWAINEVCRELYNSDEKGVTVRNLRRSDIEAVSNYDYTKFKHKVSGENAWKEVLDDGSGEELIYYGEIKKYNTNFQSPAIWEKHDKNWTYKYDKENKKSIGDKNTEVPWEQEYGSETDTGKGNTNQNTEFTQSYYSHDYINKQEEFKDLKYYDLLFKDGKDQYFNKNYWLAGRYVDLYNGACNFGLHVVSSYSSLRNVNRMDYFWL